MYFPNKTEMDFNMKKFVREAGTALSRVVQLTEEKLGTSEKTELDAHFENLAERSDTTKIWTEKILRNTEAVLTPNPGNRVEDFLFEKIEKKRPNRLSNLEYLGLDMIEAGNEFGPGTAYGSALIKVGHCEQKLGAAERDFISSASHAYVQPLRKFLDGEMKTILKERSLLESKRLDLDACKNRLRKARSMQGQQNAEKELRVAQSEFDRQAEITKLLLEGISSSHSSHLRSLHEFVETQVRYFAQCHNIMQDLQRDVARYVSPVLSAKEYMQAECAVKSFSEVGPLLQEKLQEKAKGRSNWLFDWMSEGILSDRLPLVIHSNPALILPRQEFRHPEMYIGFAAKMIAAALCYKNLIDDNEIPMETAGSIPLDMSQNMHLFGSCRIPNCNKDIFYQLDPLKPPNHIIVAHNNHFFRVPVLDICGEPIPLKKIEAQLQKVVHDSREPGKAVGILTSDHRDNWADLHHQMFKDNKEILEDIQKALFVVCLDGRSSHPNTADHRSNLQTIAALKILHGGGPRESSGNRWFDKTLQFVVSCTGEVGLCLEQSRIDFQLAMNLLTYILNVIEKTAPDFNVETEEFPEPIKLEFCLNTKMEDAIKCGGMRIKKLIDDTDVLSFTFTGFGSGFLKTHCISPDAFIQLALQLAYHRVHSETVPSYELASTRKFCRGRTEVVRTTTPETLFFVAVMIEKCSTSDQEKVEAFLRAVEAHKRRMKEAMDGQAIDRHIYGLYMTARDEGIDVSSFFCNEAFQQSCNCKLFTSQVRSPYNGGLVLGPATYHGYGVGYNPRAQYINFGLTAYKSSPCTDLSDFHDSLVQSLTEMHTLLVKCRTELKGK